jgi:guanylate kinase
MATPSIGRLFVISAPTGGGKTSLTRYVIEHLEDACNLHKVITYTTRPIRPGEVNGVDYHFITQEAFAEKDAADFFLETTAYDNFRYGCPRYALEKLATGDSLIIITDRHGARKIKELYPAALLIWIGVPSLEAVSARLTTRGREQAYDLQKRIDMAAQEVEAEETEQLFDYHFTNDNFTETAEKLTYFIKRSLESS